MPRLYNRRIRKYIVFVLTHIIACQDSDGSILLSSIRSCLMVTIGDMLDHFRGGYPATSRTFRTKRFEFERGRVERSNAARSGVGHKDINTTNWTILLRFYLNRTKE